MRRYLMLAMAVLAGTSACTRDPVDPIPGGAGPIVTFQGSLTAGCPAPHARSVLIDPTHDGGTWWFPQAATTPEGFKSDMPHQGRALADYLRAHGYAVTELGRGGTMSPDSMMKYEIIIRAGYYYDANHPGYAEADLNAYSAFAACDRTLIILAEYLRDGRHDDLADKLGIPLIGNITGTVDSFTPHAITSGVVAIPYIAGSYLSAQSAASIEVLGKVGNNAVMGLLTGRAAKIFFIGDVNGIQTVPQPFVDNLIAWGF